MDKRACATLLQQELRPLGFGRAGGLWYRESATLWIGVHLPVDALSGDLHLDVGFGVVGLGGSRLTDLKGAQPRPWNCHLYARVESLFREQREQFRAALSPQGSQEAFKALLEETLIPVLKSVGEVGELLSALREGALPTEGVMLHGRLRELLAEADR